MIAAESEGPPSGGTEVPPRPDRQAAPGKATGKNTGRGVSAATATAIVVADMVGVGVFTSLGFQVADIPSAFSILLLWLVGGFVALCGVFCYSELAAMFPRSSGEYNYLRRAFHPALGFLAGWLSATVGFAAPVALAAMAFGEYAQAVAPGAVPPLVLGLGLTWIVSLIALTGLRNSSLFQSAGTILKVALIVAFIVAGLAFGTPQNISFAPSMADLSHVTGAPFAIGLVFVMYAYSGWNAATYIVGEMDDPQRSVPRSLLTGTLIVIALYVALNALFLYTTPIAAMAGQLDVAAVAGTHIFGEMGGRVVGALICVGLVSSVSAMMWIGPRVAMVMGEDLPALRFFSRTSAGGVPVAAILFQLAMSNLMLLTQSFEAVLDFIQFSLIACSFLAVVGVIKLRITRPDLPRPYKAWGFPVTPIVFLAVTGFMMYHLVTSRPTQALIGILFMASGLLLYALSRTRAPVPATSN